MFVEVVAQTTGLMTFEVEESSRGRKALVCRMTKTYWEFMRNWQRNLLLFRPVICPWWCRLGTGRHMTTEVSSRSEPLVQRCHGNDGRPDATAHECVLGSLNYLQSIPFQFNHEQVALQQQVWDLGHAIGSLPCRERLEKPNNRKCMKRHGTNRILESVLALEGRPAAEHAAHALHQLTGWIPEAEGCRPLLLGVVQRQPRP